MPIRRLSVWLVLALALCLAAPAALPSVAQAPVTTPRAWLPMVPQDYPPLPNPTVLLAINNPAFAADYQVRWNPAVRATGYELQEDTNGGFTHPTDYAGLTTNSWDAANKADGTYYYRVRGTNLWGSGVWSNVQSTSVLNAITPNDPFYSQQWSLATVDAGHAWQQSTGTGMIVAVVDTGVDLGHPDLAAKIVAGYNVVDPVSSPQDDNGHGTHVAGIVAAIPNNGIGVAGLGWNTKLMPVKVLDARGSGTDFGVAQGISWAVTNGAQIINMSLGSDSQSNTLTSAVTYAWNQGRLVVAAAGNCGDPTSFFFNGCSTFDPPIYPAADANVLGVGATTSAEARAVYSSYGYWVDIAAPGDQIFSTFWPSTYQYDSGTSMASPLVVGLASLVWARNPALTNAQVVSAIENSANQLGGFTSRNDYYGYGRINAAAAVAAAGLVAAQGVPPTQAPARLVGPNAQAAAEPGTVLVQMKSGVQAAATQALLQRHNAQVADGIAALRVIKVTVPAGSEYQTAKDLMADPNVAYAEPNYVVKLIQ